MKFEEIYEVKEFIGKGSFAEVKKCLNRKTKELFAVKEIRLDEEEDTKKAENEVEIWGALDHMSIVHLEEVFYTGNAMLIVLEYLPGGDLFDGIVFRTHYSERDACACIRQILMALKYLRRNSIVHRDLKPENLLLAERSLDDKPPIIKLTDFGIAKRIEGGREVIRCDVSGSPMYLAPETILERPVGYGVDMWSCGVILYLLLVGYPPFWNEQIDFLLLSIIQANYTFSSPYWDAVSESAKDLIRGMLTADAEERLSVSQALSHEWIAHWDSAPSLNRRTTLVRLTAFNARRKLKGIVLGLIARKRLSGCYKPARNSVRLTRKESYTPDKDLESKVQEMLSQEELPAIEEKDEVTNGEDKVSTSPSNGYRFMDMQLQRNHTYRSSVKIKVRSGGGITNGDVVKRYENH